MCLSDEPTTFLIALQEFARLFSRPACCKLPVFGALGYHRVVRFFACGRMPVLLRGSQTGGDATKP